MHDDFIQMETKLKVEQERSLKQVEKISTLKDALVCAEEDWCAFKAAEKASNAILSLQTDLEQIKGLFSDRFERIVTQFEDLKASLDSRLAYTQFSRFNNLPRALPVRKMEIDPTLILFKSDNLAKTKEIITELLPDDLTVPTFEIKESSKLGEAALALTKALISRVDLNEVAASGTHDRPQVSNKKGLDLKGIEEESSKIDKLALVVSSSFVAVV